MIEEAMKIWKAHAIQREGRRNKVYLDSLKKPTVGIGHLVKPEDKLKLGDIISDIQIDIFFNKDSDKALNTSYKQWKEINILTPEWLAALISVNFQLGDFSVKFKNSYKLLVRHEFDKVIQNLQNSLWAKQTPLRVADFIEAIEVLKARRTMV